MKNKFIIGGGLSGLIFKYYNKDFTIIEPEKLGGQLNFKIGTQIRYLFKNSYTKKFLKDLNIKYKLKKLRIRYFYNNNLYIRGTKEMNEKYISKKLSHSNFDSIKINIDSKPRENIDSIYYDININEVLEKLSKNIEVIKNKVILVDVKNQHITLNNYHRFHYRRLISTIPANTFRHIAYNSSIKNKFKYLPTTLVITKELPEHMKCIKNKFDILYYCNDDQIFCRIWKNDSIYIYEIPGDVDMFECKKYFDSMDLNIIKHDIQRIGVIFNEKINKIKNIEFLGRLALWDSNFFVNDAIKFSQEYSKK